MSEYNTISVLRITKHQREGSRRGVRIAGVRVGTTTKDRTDCENFGKRMSIRTSIIFSLIPKSAEIIAMIIPMYRIIEI